MKSAVALRHLLFEDLGIFGEVLNKNGYEIQYAEAGETALDNLDPDLLVVLGGPIGVYEQDKYPYLADELRLLDRRMVRGRSTLGVCLGAQLMAHALGAKVYPGGRKEIGWSGLELTDEGKASPLRHLTTVLHWHGDTFDLPGGSALLASTRLYQRQAFAVGPSILGMQFHAEVDVRHIERWLIGHAEELSRAGIDVKQLRTESLKFGPRLAAEGAACLEEWLAGLS